MGNESSLQTRDDSDKRKGEGKDISSVMGLWPGDFREFDEVSIKKPRGGNCYETDASPRIKVVSIAVNIISPYFPILRFYEFD